MNTKFKYSIDNFRGLAILFVVLSHFGSFYYLGSGGALAYFVVANATAWFVFISGYLFYRTEVGRFSYRKYMYKKTKYVLLPYLVLSVPAVLAGFSLGRDKALGLSELGYIGWSLIVGGGGVVGPMWFIPMILIFFLFSPFFNWIGTSRFLLPVVVVFVLIGLFTWRPLSSLNPVLSFAHFVGFYLLGIAFATREQVLDLIRNTWISTVIIAVGVAGFVWTEFYYWDFDNTPIGFWDGLGLFNPLQFSKLCLLISIFVGFERFLNGNNVFLGYLAKISFGIFFIHGFYIAMYPWLIRHLEIQSGFARLSIEMGFVLCAAIVTVAVVKGLIGKKSRYVIGC